MNGANDQVESGLRPVVAPGAEVSALRYAAVRSDLHFGQIVDPDILADPAVIADGESPRKFHPHARLDVDFTPNVSAK